MGYSIDTATWPEGLNIPVEVKSLIERFFETVDTNRDDAGDILADELFAEDGVAYFGAHPFRGIEEIRKSRIHAWDTIETRQHKILRVYTRAPDCNDLLFVAHVAMGLKNGKNVDGEFVGRFTISNREPKGPKLSLYQVWGDTSALRTALQEK
uniref:SnoaL-like domain-containing protein n=1 Tax=Bionectria ochroleuca TaxID=29856 RepID=A0A8H7N0F5_BIOOC